MKKKLLTMKIPFVVLIAFLLVLPNSQAAQICMNDLLNCDLANEDSCLEMAYACGRYEMITHTLWAEDYAPTTVQKFYIGASLYGLYVRSRSKSLQCEFVKGAKDNLEDFLLEKEAQFNEKGTFGTVNHMNQLYTATKMLNDVQSVTGCLESAYTRSRVERMAKVDATEKAKSVFLSPSDMIKNELDSIILAIRGFVSKASDLETGLVLRRIEIKTGQRLLENIKAIFLEIFGSVTVTEQDVIVKTDILNAIDRKSSGYLQDVNQQEFEFKRALGGVSPEEYSNIRLKNLKEVDAMMKKTAFHINMVGDIVNMDKSKPLGQLNEAINVADGSQDIRDSLNDIKRAWKSYGTESGICERAGTAHVKKWYCN